MAPPSRLFRNLIPKNTTAIVIGIVLGLAAIQVVFEFLARDIARQKITTTQSYLNDTRTVSNPYLISQRIEDLEALGIVRCSVFKPADQAQDFINLSYKTGCDATYSPLNEILFFQFKRAAARLSSIDGRNWDLSFRSIHSGYFRTGLWVTRLTFVLFIILVNYFLRKTLSLRVKAYETERQLNDKIVSLAVQVAHDIRSPLVALDAALKHTEQLPEKQRVIVRHAANRIRDIANNLLEKNRQRPASTSVAVDAGHTSGEQRDVRLLSSLIDPVITEKRLQFESKPGIAINFNLSRESYGLFADIHPVEFGRVISNLVNNAVEALGDKGAVDVHLVHEDKIVVLTITDDGKGIPPEILAKLGRKGETHGKAGGSGLGLFHARSTAESWGGSLAIVSTPGKGTTITIKLPAAQTPAGFVAALALFPGRPVVVLDDDPGIHQVWQGRFDSARLKEHNIDVFHFSEPATLRAWVKTEPVKAKSAVCLFDYELSGFKETGLNLAEELGLCGQTILVSSRCEEKHIIEGCTRLKVRRIPKGLSDFVPIMIAAPAPAARAVLIDDDAIVHMNWEAAAEEAGIELKAFRDPADFLASLESFPKTTPIYIDSELGGDVKGEDIAADLREKGFVNLFLATGHPPERFARLPWLKVIGKESPWRA